MLSRLLLVFPLLIAVTMVARCSPGGPTPEARAAARFGEFQAALFAQDRAGLKKLVCRDARAVIPDLCRSAEGRKPLVITGVSRSRHEYRVHVRDAPGGDPTKEAFYVLTREDGDLRVDLLTTAAYHRYASGPPPEPKFEPGRLDRDQLEKARAALERERR